MTCKNNDIKELLPAYLESALDEPEKQRVREHIETCGDCRRELSLLERMAQEPVPDPGEAFWHAMPAKIEREVRLHQEREQGRLGGFLSGILMTRWAWATAAATVLALGSWFLLRPVPLEMAGRSGPGNTAALEEVLPDERVNLSEASSTELAAATQWAQNQLAPIGEAIHEDIENTGRSVSEDLSNLSPDELERVYQLLQKKEQDLKNRRQKSKKDIG